MRYWFVAASGFLMLSGCAAGPQLAASRQSDAYPEERSVVCAVKAGDRQNYWTERDALMNGAVVVFQGECPAEPNNEGRMQ
jgi:hypothetical protein